MKTRWELNYEHLDFLSDCNDVRSGNDLARFAMRARHLSTYGVSVKAAVCREFAAPLVIEDVELANPGPGEVQISLRASAVCHSDITYADGGWGGQIPAVYGHEAAGIVTEVGAGVTRVVAGAPVVVTLVRSCGTCANCARQLSVSCEASFALDAQTPLRDAHGNALLQGMRTGAFAEAVVVHESQIVGLPPGVPFDSAALLACGVITGFGAVTRTAHMPRGSTVAVVGCGGVGLNAVQAASLEGAEQVIAIDTSAAKGDAAISFGATHAINAMTTEPVEAVRDLTCGRGVDFVFVTVGAKSAFDQSYAMLAKGGAVVLVGMPANGALTSFDPGELANNSQRLLGSKMGAANIAVDIQRLVSLYQQGKIKLDELISGKFALADINEAMDGVRRGEALRNVIVFP